MKSPNFLLNEILLFLMSNNLTTKASVEVKLRKLTHKCSLVGYNRLFQKDFRFKRKVKG